MSLADDLRSKLDRARLNQDQATATKNLQQQGRWPEATKAWEAMAPLASHDHEAKLNYTICLYHVGRFEEVASSGLQQLAVLPGMLANACAILTLIANQRIHNMPVAAAVARAMSEQIESPWDLPGIPVMAEMFVLEEQDIGPILESLEALASANLDVADRKAITSLLSSYKERQVS